MIIHGNKNCPVLIRTQQIQPTDSFNERVVKICTKSTFFIFCVIGIVLIFVLQLMAHAPFVFHMGSGSSGDERYVSGRKLPKDMPGHFMFGKYPYNNTFCKFNYGLPKTLNWAKVNLEGSPEHGMKSPYRVIYNAVERTMLDSSYTAEHVTYATHATPEYLYHVVEIARFWDGPISIAVYVPNYDIEIAMKLLTQLCKCYDGMSKVSVHLVFLVHEPPIFIAEELSKFNTPEIDTAKNQIEKVYYDEVTDETSSTTEIVELDINHKEGVTEEPIDQTKSPQRDPSKDLVGKQQIYRDQNMINLEFKDCSNPDMSTTRSYRSRYGLIYPINVCRNVARNASKTFYNLVSDVELIPSDGLASKFTVMLKKQKISGKKGAVPKWKLAFVIPVFEVDYGEDVPRNKSSLQQLYADGKAVYFHRWVCNHCQKIPDLQTWIKDDPGDAIKPFTIIKRQFPYHRWEPIYIGTKHTPWYSETLSWEGKQDKMTQMLEMCLRSYDFVVVDGGFLCHSPGIKTKSKHGGRSWRHRHEQNNIKNYDQIVKSLAERYPPNIKCRIG